MSFTKIESTDLNGIGVIGLPDQPGLSTAAMQAKFEETARSVVIPKHNGLIDELEDTTAAASLGAVAPTGRTGATVQAILDDISSFENIESGGTTFTADGVDTFKINAGSNVTITPLASPDKGIQISASGGGGQSTGDMLMSDYDSLGTVKTAGGIPSYVASAISGKADTSSLATVATSGSFNDLNDQPTIPTVSNTYSSSSTNAMSGQAVNEALQTLDGTVTGSPGAGKTLTAFSETDGKVSATFDAISITKSQISDFPTIPDELKDLTGDVDIATTPTDGYVLTYESASSKWKPKAAGGGVTNAYKNIVSAGQTFAASGEDTFKINAGSNVTITALSSPDKGILISATGGGQSTGDMLMSDYDSDADVKSGGGIKAYVSSAISGKQDTISGGDGITVNSNTVSVDFGTVASGTTTKPPTGKAVYDAIAALDGTITGSAGTGKTLSAFSQTDGKVSATFSNISITKSQVSDLGTIPTVVNTYSSSGTDAISGTGVNAALQTLDVSDSAVSGKYVSAVSETDGKISVTRANLPTVTVEHSGTASTSAVRKQTITINNTPTEIDGSVYMESTANSASFSFTNAAILTTSAIDVWTDIWGDNPSNVEVPSAGTCNVTFSAAQTRTVRIYIK